MKNIGVLTFHNGPNFGGFLQAWHMVEAIKSLGYDASLVNYLCEAHYEANKIRLPLLSLEALKARVFWYLKKRPFKGLTDKFCTHKFTTDPNLVPWDRYDALVVGSDVVWDYQNPNFGHDPAYFGMHEKQKGMKIIAYAASCGPANPLGPFPDYVKNGCARFSALGLRDPASAELAMNAASMDSTNVVDPTWLNADPAIHWPSRPNRGYIFVYGGKYDADTGAKIVAYARKKGLKIVTALSSFPWADKKFHSLDPFQWVDLFKNAESVVIQGTLHGTAYSLKYGKPFILINGPNTRAKIAGILDKTKQSHRAFEPGELRDKDLDLLDQQVPTALESCRDWIIQSREFLKEALRK